VHQGLGLSKSERRFSEREQHFRHLPPVVARPRQPVGVPLRAVGALWLRWPMAPTAWHWPPPIAVRELAGLVNAFSLYRKLERGTLKSAALGLVRRRCLSHVGQTLGRPKGNQRRPFAQGRHRTKEVKPIGH